MFSEDSAERIELVGDAELFTIHQQRVRRQACLGVVLEALLAGEEGDAGRAVGGAPLDAAVLRAGADADRTAERVARDSGHGIIGCESLDEMVRLVPTEPRGSARG